MRPLQFMAPACAIALIGLAAASAPAQVAGQDPQQEIKELFKKVEKDLQEIDKLLNQAATDAKGGATSGAAADPKSAAKGAHDKQKEVSGSIQKIIDLVPPSQGSCSNCNNNHGLKKPGEGEGKKQGQSNPRDSQNGKRPQDSARSQQQQQEDAARQAGQAISEPQGQKQPGGSTPEDNQKSNEPPTTGRGKPREYDTERQNRSKESVERWGELPEHTRRVFENTSTDDLPMRYRKWIRDFFLRTQKPATESK